MAGRTGPRVARPAVLLMLLKDMARMLYFWRPFSMAVREW